MVWVTEAQYTEHGVCARWLTRQPPPLLPPPNGDKQRPLHSEATARESLEAPSSATGQHSQLSWAEHAWYLRHRAPEQAERLSQDDTERLQKLHAVVSAEQAAFRAQRATDTDVTALSTFHPQIAVQARSERPPYKPGTRQELTHKAQVEAILRARRQRDAALACVCESAATIDLSCLPAAPLPSLKHLGLLATAGKLRPLHTLPLGTPIAVDVLSHAKRGAGDESSKALPPPLEEDITCERLASSQQATVVLGSSAFECLASMTQSWELPVRVRAIDAARDAGKRVAFVSKPFLPNAMSLRAKNEIYYKRVVQQLLVPSAQDDSPEPALQYRLWQFGSVRMLTRCTDHATTATQAPGGGTSSVVVRVKLEYAPQRGWEETTTLEHARQWCALTLRPGATLVVAHVGVVESALLTLEHKDSIPANAEKDILFWPAEALAGVHAILLQVEQLPVGNYVLSHQSGTSVVQLLRATSSATEEALSKVRATRMEAGATDEHDLAYVPMRWQPSLSNVPQIPFTHPPLGQPVSTSRRNLRQQRLADGKQEAASRVAAPMSSGFGYCHAFAEGRTCARSARGQQCPYPHLSMQQVAARRPATDSARLTGEASLTAEMKAYVKAHAKRKKEI